MMKSNWKPILFLIIALSIASLIKTNFNYKKGRIHPPPTGLENVHFDFNEIIADSLWLTYIQQAWNCQNEKLCYPNWGFRVLDEVTLLSPRFKNPYIHGATMLSVLLDDRYGAKVIFDRGLIEYPDDWLLNYRAGYHYLVELNNNEKAADLLNHASIHGAPHWTKSLAARLYEKSGNLEISEALIISLIASSNSPEWKESLQKRLKDVQIKKRKLDESKIKSF